MIGLNKKHIQKEELQQAVNDLLEAGIQAIHAMVLTFARLIRSLARLKSRCHETATACFISTLYLTTSSTLMS